MLRRTGMKQRANARAAADPERVRVMPVPVPGAFRLPQQVDGRVNAAPKEEKLRSPLLLSLAHGEACMLQIPGRCLHGTDTTVQCHSNLGAHGKGKGTKAHDCCSFSGCQACHFWLDQDKTPSYEEKRHATMQALQRQIERWKSWASGNEHSAKQRVAAVWALSKLYAMSQANSYLLTESSNAILVELRVQEII